MASFFDTKAREVSCDDLRKSLSDLLKNRGDMSQPETEIVENAIECIRQLGNEVDDLRASCNHYAEKLMAIKEMAE